MPSFYFAGRERRGPVLVQPIVLDIATLAWVAAVIANGGTVSASRKSIVDDLIAGLKADGLFTKLDRLWLFAAENEPSALTDIIADALATNVNTTTFTTDRGYTGNGSSMYIDSNFNASTATSPHFLQDSACFFAWNNTAGVDSGGFAGFAASDNTTRIDLEDNTFFFTFCEINAAGGAGISIASTGATGLWLVNRTSAGASTLDVNASLFASGAGSSTAPANRNFVALSGGTLGYSNHQASCLGFGGGLSATDRTNLYARLRTYMTAVGVP